MDLEVMPTHVHGNVIDIDALCGRQNETVEAIES
jgi:hypothetical protein